jgi:SAM-dependent methyltransferase
VTAVSGSLDRYDTIGVGYRRQRQPDPRIAVQINAALTGARRVLNVGAGTGSYEPADADVVALDASSVMLGQHDGRRRVQGASEELPFPDHAFDAAMAIFTVHHWRDPAAGLAEMKRVARRQVVLTFDHEMEGRFWLNEYVPSISQQQHSWVATIEAVADPLGTDHVEVVPVPHDCVDGFMAAYWRRPERYLDPEVRAAISGLALLDPADVEPGLARLRADLASGEWDRRHGHLRALEELDAGYRLVVA